MRVVGILLAIFAFLFAKEIKIGVLLPFSGVFSGFGNQIKRGLNVIYIYHQSLPNGDKVKVIFVDNGSNKTQTIFGYKRLVNEGVVAVVGPFSSSN
ncbi:MAG: ABC transporter substrate-binding protein, partial [Nautiliaceae bacterium]